MSWQPTASLHSLQTRSDLLWKVRSFFHSQGMLEVQTPLLSCNTVVDRHIEPVQVPGTSLGLPESSGQTFFLQTSPEFAMKRLLAAGMTGIYQICPVFRSGERGEFHNPEFTMVEWYRVGDNYQQAIHLLAQMMTDLGAASSIEYATYQSVFLRHTSCDPLAASVEELTAAATSRLAVDQDWSSDRDDWLNLLFSEVIQPNLGKQAPTIVTHFPASQSALARVSEENPLTADRFELFIGGVELANGYNELLDADELALRNERVNQQRVADGHAALPAESWLLDAMRSGLPACSGCALGLDRLLMVLTNAETIDEVIAFPIERS